MSQPNESAQAADALRHSHDRKANNLLFSLQTMAKISLTQELQALIKRADACGLVIDFERIPLPLLSAGAYKTEITLSTRVVN